jgi:O-methyltransferase domain/Dimerisation domain
MTQSTSTTPQEVPAGQLVFQVASGFMASAALQVAVRLDIAARLSNGPRPVADLAREAGVQTDGLYRVLRALASVSIFVESSPRTFALTPAAELLRKRPGSLGDGIEFITDPLHFQTYAQALHSVQTGQPAGEKVVGMPLFEYLSKTPQWSASFNNAMTAFSANVMPAVLKAYDFSGIGTLIDVAGGHGHVLTSVLREHPQMRGVLFDLEHVIAGSGPLLAASGVQNRVRAESGDFFKAVPAGGDAYIMKHIIHDWDDERAAAILSNIRKALDGKPEGRVILLEAVLAAGNAPDFAKLLDLEMMLFPGGRERTAEEFGALFDRVGLKLTKVVPTESMLSVVEARTR